MSYKNVRHVHAQGELRCHLIYSTMGIDKIVLFYLWPRGYGLRECLANLFLTFNKTQNGWRDRIDIIDGFQYRLYNRKKKILMLLFLNAWSSNKVQWSQTNSYLNQGKPYMCKQMKAKKKIKYLFRAFDINISFDRES